MRNLALTLLLLLFSATVVAQESWESLYEELLEMNDEENYLPLEQLYEELSELHTHPLNLNAATREELETLPFLSSVQIDNLLDYLRRNGPMESVGELLLVKELDYTVRRLLIHFVYIGRVEEKEQQPSLKNLLKRGRHEAIARMDVPFYEKAGYADYSDSILARYPNRRYLGGRVSHSLRYNFKCADKLQLGFVLEQDAGEPFFSHGTRSYDYHSFYLLLTNMKWLKTLAVGHYRLRFGQGLVMNTDFNPGKTAMLSSLGWGGRGIKKHSSTSEYNAFQGAASTLRFGKMEVTGFFSHRKQDATLDNNLFITSLKTDGLHRTPLEYSKRGNVSNTLFGSNLTYHHKAFHSGLTAVYNVFNRQLKPADVAYKRYYPRGREFFAMSADYLYLSYRLNLSGETAFSGNGGWATLNRLQLRAWDDCLLTLVQRYYSRDYQALYANSFSENTEVRNECGLYLGVEASPWKRWTLSGYADLCYFPWLRYRASASSYAGETMLKATYASDDNTKTSLRYRLKMREVDYTSASGKKYLVTFLTHRLRFQQDCSLTGSWILTALVDYCATQMLEDFNQGFMLTARTVWKPQSLPISLYANASYFHTDNYNTRISTYERGLLHTFSFPSYYGHGYHLASTVHWVINRQFTTLVKISHTHYFDRSTIGSGTELINASHREDISFQLRWKF